MGRKVRKLRDAQALGIGPAHAERVGVAEAERHRDHAAALQQFFADRGLLEYEALLDVESLIDRRFADEAREEVGSFDFE